MITTTNMIMTQHWHSSALYPSFPRHKQHKTVAVHPQCLSCPDLAYMCLTFTLLY